MGPQNDDKTKPGPSKGLDRTLIVDTALAYIDEHGAQSLSMRALGQQLGVVPMALYRHVHGREDLLEAVVAKLLDSVGDDLDDEMGQHSWQGYLQLLAHRVRDVAVEHPAAFPLVATRHPSAPWLRPPLRSLSIVEHFLSTLLGHGFSEDQVVEAYRSFSSFLLGQLLLEAAVRGAETSPVEMPLDEGGAQISHDDAGVDLNNSPVTARLRPKLSEDHSVDQFELALETLIDRFEMELSQ